ncbi:hypothetical protein [Allorhizobium taibaishanense]|uniref:Uncharacterized protein n=1 Tax=Allorhizobium taibaishanense TaxID=887144 RepID=A0A1Q9A285_9HYPH|nr:hypothetical protein [Allorhizobium taibaishanense]MBB4009068.1 hypothetical protein [Allorhizobium taibaishanense]OLP48629.1 hypothetical protein BJF91_01405 [Allorhizobium taibaishanense]
MKKIFLASALAIASMAGTIIPAHADTVIIRDNDRRGPPRHMHRAPPPHCEMRRIVRWHHGEKFVKVVRVCR